MTVDAAPPVVDLLVGLVSCNDASSIGPVAAALRAGVDQHFGGATSRFVLADCASTDDTPARARNSLKGAGDVLEVDAAPTTADLLEAPYHGIPGKARALHGILSTAQRLGARACVVFDAGVDAVTSQWLESLAGPVLGYGFDLVSPFFQRHRYEGALTKGIVYPMFRALYGVRLRQPAAGEFACSARLVDRFIEQSPWDRDGAQTGIDLWLASAAVSGDFRIGEVTLGGRRRKARGDDPLDLGTTVTQVVGSLFADLDVRVEKWQRVRSSVPVQLLGEPQPGAMFDSGAVDPETLIESFRLGYRELRDVWTWVLPPRTILDLRRLMDASTATFRLDAGLWARIVYDFALGYRLRVLPREHILRSLVPLYLAWFASFIVEVRDRGEDDVERHIEQLCAAFEAEKPYLISKWRWPERLRT